ncbi:recombinase family protein [Clostridium botulinum]|nr:recombinase family protein [Clostridium botulinum]MCS6106542.1 recombinase family protein [Clostridium botulinum]MCS6130424.1 recombinase family protein [Clostridium botulinum]NFL44777.1 recombinase family protein [Clostridium botulinum]NFL88822.1 recombinase family protein [Clostridium botulinum]
MKVAIYTRKSKFTEEGESIENQIKMCIKYAETMLEAAEYEIYEDEGFSGGNIDRPKFKKMMKDIKAKKFTHLICYRLDRISRNVADFTSTLEILNEYNVSFISIKEQFDTSSAMGRAMMNISATFAQLERETIAERIKDNLRELAKTGRWLGGPAPMGYKSIEVENSDNKGKSRKKHILEINPNEIELVKLVFKLFIEHKSFQKVSGILENQGLYSRSGKVFSRELVKQTINNPIYVIADKKLFDFFKENGCETYEETKINNLDGIMPYNRRKENGSFAPINNWIISVGDHPGIISSDLWIRCQTICKEIKQKASNRQCTSQEALLSGLIICARCGSGMAPRQNKSGKYHYRYYSCNLRNKSASRCDNDALNAYDAEEYVVKYLKSLKAEDIIENYNKSKSANKIKLDNFKSISNYKKEIEENNKFISGLIKKMAIEEDEDLLQDYKKERKSLKTRNAEIELIISDLELKNNSLTDIKESLDDILSAFDDFKKFFDYSDFNQQQQLIRGVVKFIVWDYESEFIDIILIGSDKKRPKPGEPFLPLSNSNRRNGTCRDACYYDLSTYGECNIR